MPNIFNILLVAVPFVLSAAVCLAAQPPTPPVRMGERVQEVPAPKEVPAALIKKVGPSVVRVTRSDGGTGTGVLIDADGKGTAEWVLTCHHVAQPGLDVTRQVMFENPAPKNRLDLWEVYDVTCVPGWASQESDLCLLKLPKAVARRPLPLADQSPERDAIVHLIGHPSDTPHALPQDCKLGRIETFATLGAWKPSPLAAKAVDTKDEALLYTLSNLTDKYRGNSGAPVLTADGKVTGVLSANVLEGTDKRFPIAVALPELRRFINRQPGNINLPALKGKAEPTAAGPEPLPPNDPKGPNPPARPPAPLHTKVLANGKAPGPQEACLFSLVRPQQLPAGAGPTLFEPNRTLFLGKNWRFPGGPALLVNNASYGFSFSAPNAASAKETVDPTPGRDVALLEVTLAGEAKPSVWLTSHTAARTPNSYRRCDDLLDNFDDCLLWHRRAVLCLHRAVNDGNQVPAGRKGVVEWGALHAGSDWGSYNYTSNLTTAWTYRHYTDAKQQKDWVALFVLHGGTFTVAWFEAPSADLQTEAGRRKHADKALVLLSLATAPR